MAQQAQVLAFPAPRRDAPISTFIDGAEARKTGTVADLSAVRRQRAFEAASGQLHDFEVDLLGSIIGALSDKRRARVKADLEAYARWAPNQPYKAAASRLLSRWERL